MSDAADAIADANLRHLAMAAGLRAKFDALSQALTHSLAEGDFAGRARLVGTARSLMLLARVAVAIQQIERTALDVRGASGAIQSGASLAGGAEVRLPCPLLKTSAPTSARRWPNWQRWPTQHAITVMRQWTAVMGSHLPLPVQADRCLRPHARAPVRMAGLSTGGTASCIAAEASVAAQRAAISAAGRYARDQREARHAISIVMWTAFQLRLGLSRSRRSGPRQPCPGR